MNFNIDLNLPETRLTEGTKESTVVLTDVISEGPIKGIVGGTSGVFLNNIAMEGAQLAPFSPIRKTLSNGTVEGSVTFSGSSTTGTVNVDLPENLTVSSSDSYHRHLVLRDLFSFDDFNATVETSGGRYDKTKSASASKKVSINIGRANTFPSGANTGADEDMNAVLETGTHQIFGQVTKVGTSDRLKMKADFTSNVPILPSLDLTYTGVQGRYPNMVLRVQKRFRITGIDSSAGEITVSGGNPPAGTYTFLITEQPSQNNSGDYTDPDAPVSGFNNVSVQFRQGTRVQRPLNPVPGVGAGIGISKVSNPAHPQLRQMSSAGLSTLGILNGTGGFDEASELASASEATIITPALFGLSAVQIQEIDEINFTIGYSSLQIVKKSDGAASGVSVDYDMKIERTFVDPDTGITTVKPFVPLFTSSSTISGRVTHTSKSNSAIEFDHVIDLTQFRPFTDFKIRLVRVTPAKKFGSTDDYQVNTQSAIGSMTVRINDNFTYPHTAIAQTAFSSRTFNSYPRRSYLVEGMMVQIPSSYIPREYSNKNLAEYSGFWNGAFHSDLHYTNNPAWVFYDLLTNKRYGAGEHITEDLVDKYDLYRIARYCDELVETGDKFTVDSSQDEVRRGEASNLIKNEAYIIKSLGNITNWSAIGNYDRGTGTAIGDAFTYNGTAITTSGDATNTGIVARAEPRFTSNLYLSKATEVYKVLKDMASMFTSMLYWMDGKLVTIQDTASDPVYNFSKANVIDGRFEYETTGRNTRFNQITVAYNDERNNFEPTPIIVEDRLAIIKDGKIKKQEAVAFGCTSESQAIRFGRWKLFTAQNQTEIVSFTTSFAANFLRPGDVINVADSDRTGKMYSGRIKSATSNTITFDRSVPFNNNTDEYTLLTLVTDSAAYYAGQEPIVVNSVTYNRGDKITQAYVHEVVSVTSTLTSGRTYKIIDPGTTDFSGSITGGVLPASPNGGDLFVGTGNSGSGTGTVIDLSNPVLTTIANEEQASNAYVNSDGTELIQINWSENSYVQENIVTNPNQSSTTATLASGNFGTTPDANTVWALKETEDGLETTSSSKQYKIIIVNQSEKNKYQVNAVRHFNEKYDAVDKDFNLSVVPQTTFSDTPTVVPPPKAIFIKSEIGSTNAKYAGTINIEIGISPPDNLRDSNIDSFELAHNIFDEAELSTRKISTSTLTYGLKNLGPMDLIVRVRSLLANGKGFSEWVTLYHTIETKEDGPILTRVGRGIPRGAITQGVAFLDGTTFKLPLGQISSFADPDNIVSLSDKTQACSALPSNTEAHIIFDESETGANELKLMSYDTNTLTEPFFKDLGTGNTLTNFGFTNISGTYSIAKGLNTITTNLSSSLEKGDLLSIGNTIDANLVGGRCAIVTSVDATTVTLDRVFDEALSSVSLARVTYRPDTFKDASLGLIKNSSGTLSWNTFSVTRDNPIKDGQFVENLTGGDGSTSGDGLEVGSGGLVINGGGAIRSKTGSTIKPNETNTDAGFFLGYNGTSSKYTFGLGDGAGAGTGQFIKWDGTDLTISGATLTSATIDAASAFSGTGVNFAALGDTPANFTGASEKFVRVNTGSGGNGTALEFIAPASVRTAIGAGTSSFDGAYSSLSGKPTLFDGAYSSLSGKPTLFDGAASSLTGNINLTSQVTGILPVSNMAATALTTVQTASSQSAQLALTTEEGDVVVRSDLNKTFMRNSGTAGTMADFTELATPTDAVTSVNGQTGVVTISTGAGSIGSTEIADNSVTNAKLANVATSTIKGRVTSSTGDPEDLTAAQVRTLLNVADGATVGATTAQVTAIGLNTAKTSFPGFGTSSTTALAGDTSLLQLGTSSTTALAGDTALFDGAYSSLSGKPTLFDGAYSSLSGKPTLVVNFSDLGNKPTTISGYGITDALTLGTSSTTALAGDTSLLQLGTSSTTALAGNTSLFDGAYSSLSGKPTLFDGAYSSLSGKPTLVVNFSDLGNKPTTISGYGITDALTIGTTSTTALAGNTTIPTPAMLSDGSTPTLNSGITAAEVRTLIGAGTSSSTGTVTSIATTAPITGGTITGSGTIGINEATTSLKGAMSPADKTKLDIFSVSGVTDIPLNQTFGNIAAKLANFETLNATTANIDFLNSNAVITRDIRVGPDTTINATAMVSGRRYTINGPVDGSGNYNGTTDFTGLGANASSIGVLFTYDGSTVSGNGTVRDYSTTALIGGTDASPTLAGQGAHLNSVGDFFVGVHNGSRIFFDQSAGTLTVKGTLDASDIIAGTLNASSINDISLTSGANGSMSIDSGNTPGQQTILLGNGSRGDNYGNVAIGYNAAQASTSSDSLQARENVSIGTQAGRTLTTGFENIFIGAYSGSAGSGATANKTGQNNIGIGATGLNQFPTLRDLTSGSKNIAFGEGAGRNITTGSGNVIIGGYAGNTTDENTVTLATGPGVSRMHFDTNGNATIGGTLAIDGGSAVQTKTIKILATALTGMGQRTFHTATNKNVVVEEMVVFMDMDNTAGNQLPIFSANPNSGDIRCSLLSEYGTNFGTNQRDAVCSVKAKELNQPSGVTGMKSFFVASPRDPTAADADTQRQIAGTTGDFRVKIQVALGDALFQAAVGSWYIYVQVKFREFDVQSEIRNATFVETVT